MPLVSDRSCKKKNTAPMSNPAKNLGRKNVKKNENLTIMIISFYESIDIFIITGHERCLKFFMLAVSTLRPSSEVTL